MKFTDETTTMYKIQEILYNYYGEERVDYNDDMGSFLIHFPEVTITNENNQSIRATDLWVDVPMNPMNGVLRSTFKIARTTFNRQHYASGYVHSHCEPIYWSDFEPEHIFRRTCYGSGPIKTTMTSLMIGYDVHLWELFCVELDKFVATESLIGGPYIRLEYVSTPTLTKYLSMSIPKFGPLPCLSFLGLENSNAFWGAFLKKAIYKGEEAFRFYPNNGVMSVFINTRLAKILTEIMLEHIDAGYDEEYRTSILDSIMTVCTFNTAGAICRYSNNHGVNISTYVDTPMFKFKDNDVYLRITDSQEGSHTFLMLDESIVYTIAAHVELYVNYKLTKLRRIENDNTEIILCN